MTATNMCSDFGDFRCRPLNNLDDLFPFDTMNINHFGVMIVYMTLKGKGLTCKSSVLFLLLLLTRQSILFLVFFVIVFSVAFI